jgi:hypothetical protein
VWKILGYDLKLISQKPTNSGLEVVFSFLHCKYLQSVHYNLSGGNTVSMLLLTLPEGRFYRVTIGNCENNWHSAQFMSAHVDFETQRNSYQKQEISEKWQQSGERGGDMIINTIWSEEINIDRRVRKVLEQVIHNHLLIYDSSFYVTYALPPKDLG